MNMFRRVLPAAALLAALVLAPGQARAQFGGMGGMGGGFGNFAPGEPGETSDFPVKVETAGGTVSGTIRLSRVYLQCDLGSYSLRASKVKAIRFPTSGQDGPFMGGGVRGQFMAVPALVTVESGDQIQGTVLLQGWQVQTELGTLTLVPGTLKSLTVTGEGKPVPQRAGVPKAATTKKAEERSQPAPKGQTGSSESGEPKK